MADVKRMIMKKILVLLACVFFVVGCSNENNAEPIVELPIEKPDPLAVGYSLGISNFSTEKLQYAKSAGIDHVEVSGTNVFFDSNRNFTKTDEEAKELMRKAKKAADGAGIAIWSIHMPYSAHMDLSTVNEKERLKVIEGHKKLIQYLAILEPEVVLFHPSYYLDPPKQRDMRKSQLIKSAIELDDAAQDIGATLVLENMLGPELMAGARERPLMRTVEETVEIFNRLPATIQLAIDMNHIKNPERLIRAMGERLKTVHIADGTGRAENHFFPCSGEGENDWVEILSALNEVNYNGPFLFESAYEDENDLVNCYHTLYNRFINVKN